MFVCLRRRAKDISTLFLRSMCREMCSDSHIPVKAANVSSCNDHGARKRLIWIDCEVRNVWVYH